MSNRGDFRAMMTRRAIQASSVTALSGVALACAPLGGLLLLSAP
jgi:hypothetical protein